MIRNQINPEDLPENEKLLIKEIIEQAIISQEQHPIIFDNIWGLLGYERKDAFRNLRKLFKSGKDYTFSIKNFVGEQPENEKIPRVTKMTLDCAINFAKTTNIPKSKAVGEFMFICRQNFEKDNPQFVKEVVKINIKDIMKIVESQPKYTHTEETIKEETIIVREPKKKGRKPKNKTQNETTKKKVEKIEKQLKIATEEIPQKQLNLENATSEVDLEMLFRKMDVVHSDILVRTESYLVGLWDKIHRVQTEIYKKINTLEKEVLILNKHLKGEELEDVFVLLVTSDAKNKQHKFFVEKNPIYNEEDAKKYIELDEVLFFMNFNSKDDAENMKKHIFALLKLQNVHIREDYFEFQPKHFLMFDALKASE